MEAVASRAQPLEDLRSAPAMAQIYRDHVRAVTHWARALAGPRVDVDDVVQDVFATALRQLPGFRAEAKLRTWLFGITRNVVRAERRRARWRRFWGGPDRDEALESLPSPVRDPAEALEQRQLRERLYRALAGLGERQRTAFILFEVEELSGEEIAERMGLKLSTLWVTLHRARGELSRRLDELEGKET
ncbi:MAG: RNA polymerase sigma factor [Myxococcales bacterium]